MMTMLDFAMRPSVQVLVALLLAAAGHWGLARLRRRLPLLLTRRALGRPAPHPDPAFRRAVVLGLLPLEVGIWVGVGWYASDRFAGLAAARDGLVHAVARGLEMPLFTMNDRGYSLLDLLALPAVIAALWLAMGAATRLVQSRLAAAGVENAAHGTWGMLVRYGGTLLGALLVLQLWGVDVRTLAIVGSVLGVGLGFGLQNLANNFVSGLVITLERPIKPGDYVKVGEFQGTVAGIGARSTEIVTGDRISILVPNSKFLESEVINWSHGNPIARLTVPVGVAYGSDVRAVRAALVEAARGHPRLLEDRVPRVALRGFGDSALLFELVVWSDEPGVQEETVSDLNYRIEGALRRHGIEIPFPQRDLRLRAPELGAVVAALARRRFSEAELDAVRAELAQRTASNGDGANVAEVDPGQHVWDAAALARLVERMHGPGGLVIADRRHHLALYRRCFVGREAVDWLVAREGLTRDEAVRLGQRLVEHGLVHHVLDEHPFRDAPFFYRFRADEDPPVGHDYR